MLTPETTASTGSPPPERTEYAFSTAFRPLAEEMTSGREPAAGFGGDGAVRRAAAGRIAALLIRSRRVGPLMRSPSFVRQLGLLGNLALGSGREEVHDQVGQVSPRTGCAP